MASSGSSGRAPSGSRSFDFGSDDVLCSYDDYASNDPSNGKRLDPSGKDLRDSRTGRPLENPSYAKCRDRPFPPYKDMAFLTERTTATGRYAFASTMPAAQTVESSSSSSPGSSAAPQYANIRAPQTSDYPSSTPDIPNIGGSASGSEHSSGSKRPRSPQPTNPQPKHTSSSGGRRRKPDAGLSVISELVDIGRQKLELAREIYQHEKANKHIIPTISDCMTRVYAMPGITPEKVLIAGDALKDPNNRELFMTMTDELAKMWVEHQVAMQSGVYKPFFPGM